MSPAKPLLSLCVIVKNEGAHLLQAVKSVEKIVDEVIVVDTGSTDNTILLARSCATLVVQIPWGDDFSAARNLSLEEARGKWILVLDADEKVHPEDVPLLRQTLLHQEAEAFFVNIINHFQGEWGQEEEVFPALRLFRNRPEYRYHGAVHEQLNIPRETIILSPIRIYHDGNLPSFKKGKERGERNIRILKKELEKEPNHSFQLFNLGIEYMALKQYEDATAQLEKARILESEDKIWLPRLYKMLTYCYLQVHQLSLAKKIIAEGKAKYKDYIDLYYLEGMVALQERDDASALRCFYHCLSMDLVKSSTEAIKEDTVNLEKVYYSIGKIYEKRGDNLRAKIAYTSALQNNPTFLISGIRLISLLSKDYSQEEIMDFFKGIYATEEEKRMQAACLLRGFLYFSSGDFSGLEIEAGEKEVKIEFFLLYVRLFLEEWINKLGKWKNQIPFSMFVNEKKAILETFYESLPSGD